MGPFATRKRAGNSSSYGESGRVGHLMRSDG
jgi:hypothetical protein